MPGKATVVGTDLSLNRHGFPHAQELDVSRNTVRRYLKSPEAMRPKPRRRRVSELDPYAEYIDQTDVGGVGKLRSAAPGIGRTGL